MSDDLISRETAIDAIDEQIKQCDKSLSSFSISLKDAYAVKVERASLVAFREILEYLPPAEPKLVKCDYVKACNKVTMNKTFSALRYLAMLDDFEEEGYVLVDMRGVTE